LGISLCLFITARYFNDLGAGVWERFLRCPCAAMWPNKVKPMNTPLPNAPTEPTNTEESKKLDIPEDAAEEPFPPDGDEEPGESDEVDPEEPVGTSASNQPAP